MKVLHVNFDVSRYWPYWQGGVPAVIGNIIRYTAGPDLSYRYLTADYRYTSYQQEGNVHILPFSRRYWLRFFLNPLNMLRLLKDIDIIHFHHRARCKMALYFKLFKPSIRIVETVYTWPTRSSTLAPFLVSDTLAISNNLRNTLIAHEYKSKRINQGPIMPDIEKYDINNYSVKDEENCFTLWYSVGPKTEMGIFYLLDEIELLNQEPGMRDRVKVFISIHRPEFGQVYNQVVTRIRERKLRNTSMATPDFSEDVATYMSTVDGLVYPIINHNSKMNVPLMMLEAMLMKRIIITTSTGGIPEIVDEDSGFMFHPERGNLAETIKKIIALPENELERRRENARVRAFSYSQGAIEAYREFYRKQNRR